MKVINTFDSELWFNTVYNQDEDLYFDNIDINFDPGLSSFRLNNHRTVYAHPEMSNFDLLVETSEDKEKREGIESELLTATMEYHEKREKKLQNMIERYAIEIPIEEEKERINKQILKTYIMLKQKKRKREERRNKQIQKACKIYAEKKRQAENISARG